MIGEERFYVDEELDRLNNELDDLAEDLLDAEAGSQAAQMLQRRAASKETQGAGLSWLLEEYGDGASLTVAGLDAGRFANVDDRAADISASRRGDGGAPGSRRNVFAAVALEDGCVLDDWAKTESENDPRINGGPYETWSALTEEEPLDRATLLDIKLGEVVARLPKGVVDWLEDRANELTSVDEGNFKPLATRLREKSGD